MIVHVYLWGLWCTNHGMLFTVMYVTFSKILVLQRHRFHKNNVNFPMNKVNFQTLNAIQ